MVKGDGGSVFSRLAGEAGAAAPGSFGVQVRGWVGERRVAWEAAE